MAPSSLRMTNVNLATVLYLIIRPALIVICLHLIRNKTQHHVRMLKKVIHGRKKQINTVFSGQIRGKSGFKVLIYIFTHISAQKIRRKS